MGVFVKTLFPRPIAARRNDGQQTETRQIGLCLLSDFKFPGDRSMTSLAQKIIRPLNWLTAVAANALLTLLAAGDSVPLALSCGFGVVRYVCVTRASIHVLSLATLVANWALLHRLNPDCRASCMVLLTALIR